MHALKITMGLVVLSASIIEASPSSTRQRVNHLSVSAARTGEELAILGRARYPTLLLKDRRAQDLMLRRIVEKMNQKQIEAFNKGDMLGVAHIYADDAMIIFPNYQAKQGRKIQGRVAIDKYWLAIGKPKSWSLEVFEVGGTKDAIWVLGKSTLTEEYDGKDHTYVGDFVVIWKRQKDGSYRIHTDIYN